jgi:hypothetical protein
MKLYKDNQNNVYAYELDGSQDHLIGEKFALTQTELDEREIKFTEEKEQIQANS